MDKESTENFIRDVKASLAQRGKTLAAWARETNEPMTTVWNAARGHRHGKKSLRIRRQLERLVNA